jgi:uncharacterized membrane-anchored protein
MKIVAFLTKGQEGAILTKQGRRKGNSMRGLPDSAILGTYGRMKHAGNKRHRRSAKDYQETADFLNHMINKAIQKKLDKKSNLTKV